MATIKLKDRVGTEAAYIGVDAVQVPDEDGNPVTFKLPSSVAGLPMDYRLLCPSSLPAVTSESGWELVAGRLSVTVLSMTVEGASSPVLWVTDALGDNPLSITGTTLEHPNALFYACEALTNVTISALTGVTLAAGWTAAVITGSGQYASITAQELLPATALLGLPSDLTVQLPAVFYKAFADARLETKSVSVTQNGTQTITADEGDKGLYAVDLTVNVPSSGGNLQSKSVAVTENGTVTVSPDAGYDGLSAVEIAANVPSSGGNAVYTEMEMTAGQLTVPTATLLPMMGHGTLGIDTMVGLLIDATALGAGVQRAPMMGVENDVATYTFTLGGFNAARSIVAYITMTCVMGAETSAFTITYAEFGGTDVTAMLGAIPIKLYVIQLPISE